MGAGSRTAAGARVTSRAARRVVLGLGGNHCDVRGRFESALDALSVQLGPLRRGGLYRTEPLSRVRQPDFWNTVVLGYLPETRTDRALHRTARHLVGLAKALERQAGRENEPGGERDGPRPLDIDLLFLAEHCFAGPSLELPALAEEPSPRAHADADEEPATDPWPGPIRVPHPRWSGRRFVLRPLLDLAESVPGAFSAEETGAVRRALARLGEAQRIEALAW